MNCTLYAHSRPRVCEYAIRPHVSKGMCYSDYKCIYYIYKCNLPSGS